MRKSTRRVSFALMALFLLEQTAMSQQTKDELTAEKERLQLEKDVLTLRKDVETARRALQTAESPPAPTATESATTAKAEADAVTAKYNAQKAAADAQKAADEAALKQVFGSVPNSGLSGAVSIKQDAGKGEGTLLAAVALDSAAVTIASAITAPGTDRQIIVFTGDERPRFQNWRMFALRQRLLKEAFELAKTIEGSALGAAAQVDLAPAMTGGGSELPPIAVAGAALEAAKNLGSFFQTDYEIGNVTVSLDDKVLAAAVIRRLVEKGIAVSDPSRLSPVGQDPLLPLLQPLSADSLTAPQRIASMEARAKAAREAATAQETSATRKEQLVNVAAAFDRAASAWKGAAAAYETLMKDVATSDAGGLAWGIKVSEEKAVSEGLAAGDLALFLRVNSSVGSYYTKKNLWTFFGTMPFSVMGGAVVSYTLVNGKTGAVVKAGMEPVHSGYRKVNEVPGVIATKRSIVPAQAGAAGPQP